MMGGYTTFITSITNPYHNFGEGVDMIVDAHSLYEVADELEVL